MQHRFIRSLIAAAATLLAVEARAQVDTVTIDYGKVVFTYGNARTDALPFALDFVHGGDGSIALRPASTHDVTFKRGTFYPADKLPQAWLGFDVERRGGRRVGQLDIALDQSADGNSPGGGPHIKIFDGTARSAASIHVGSAHMLMGDGSVHFIRDNVDVTLSGSPAQYFNRPGPGEPLEAHLPTPAPGEAIALRLVVRDDRGARMVLPVRISHAD